MSAVYVNVDCANIYEEEKYRSPIASQAVLWEELKVITAGPQFSKVICEDGYQGWISNNQIIQCELQPALKIVSEVLTNVYQNANSSSDIIRRATAGSYLPVLKDGEKWCQTSVPDGQHGFVEKIVFQNDSGNTREVITSMARKYLGIPYFWGGKTARGLDCSGYIQLLHKLAGINIRRDSPMQFEDAAFVGENINDGLAGDLLFFAEDGNRITHVALKLDDNKIIHARGLVKFNSLEKDNNLYDETLIRDFVAVKSFL